MPKATKPSKPSKTGNKVKDANPKTEAKSVKLSERKSSKGKAPLQLYSNFLPITLQIPTPSLLPSSSSSSTQLVPFNHTIYIRPHVSKKATEEDGQGRTLFVANVPVDMTERDLRNVFGRFGVVESVELTGREDGDVLESAVIMMNAEDDYSDLEDSSDDDKQEPAQAENKAEPTFQGNMKPNLPRRQRQRRKPALPPSVPQVVGLPPLHPRSVPYGLSGQRCAHITFLDALPVQRAMSHSAPIRLEKFNEGEPTGLQYYIAQYSSLRPPMSDVKAFADSSVERYDHLHSLLLSSRAKKQGAGALVDEDGFTVVVRGGRYGRTGGRGKGAASVGVATKGFKGDGAKGMGAGELPDFYKFQSVDRKRQELANLRTKFEQEKAKVAEMKKSKRFRPY